MAAGWNDDASAPDGDRGPDDRAEALPAAPPPVPAAPQPPPPRPALPQPAPPVAYPVAGAYPGHPGGVVVLPKSPGLMALASFLLPGLGSILCEQAATGLLILAIWAASFLASMFFLLIPVIGWLLDLLVAPFAFGAWLFGMLHAYQAAQTWNRNIGVIS